MNSALLIGQVVGRNLGQRPIDVLGSVGQLLQLQEQDRCQVERDFDVGILGHQRRHVVVILGGMDPDPGAGNGAVLRAADIGVDAGAR